MFDGIWRERVDRRTMPIGKALVSLGVTADILTLLGLVFAIGTAFVVASGHLIFGVPLLILTGFPDLFDGPVAKAAGTASVRGAFFDSVTDRISDGVVMGGVSWYLISSGRGHFALVPFAVLGVSSVISYERAKAEALGIKDARGGIMERAERMILLGIGFFAPWLLVIVLWVLLGMTTLTALGRFRRVWQAAEGPPVQIKTETRSESRFRPRRDDAMKRKERSEEILSKWRERRRDIAIDRIEKREKKASGSERPDKHVSKKSLDQ